MQFTRNDRGAARVNDAANIVVGIDAEARTLTAIDARGREHTLTLDRIGDRLFRHGWIDTVHGSQGATVEWSMTLKNSGEHRGRENRLCRDQPRPQPRGD